MDRPITTAAELDAMTPAERTADFDSRVITTATAATGRAAALLDKHRGIHIERLIERGILAPSDRPA